MVTQNYKVDFRMLLWRDAEDDGQNLKKKWFAPKKVYSQAGQGKLLKEVYRTRLIPILSS